MKVRSFVQHHAHPAVHLQGPARRHGTTRVITLIAVSRHMQSKGNYRDASSAQQALAFALESGQLDSLNHAWPVSLFSMTPTAVRPRFVYRHPARRGARHTPCETLVPESHTSTDLLRAVQTSFGDANP
jgi:hypothetical protein